MKLRIYKSSGSDRQNLKICFNNSVTVSELDTHTFSRIYFGAAFGKIGHAVETG